MRLFKTYERDLALFKSKNIDYIGKLANIKVYYKRFSFESKFENCIIVDFIDGGNNYPLIYDESKCVFYINFLSSEKELKSVIFNEYDIDVFIDLI
jgi:hypothetical protein